MYIVGHVRLASSSIMKTRESPKRPNLIPYWRDRPPENTPLYRAVVKELNTNQGVPIAINISNHLAGHK